MQNNFFKSIIVIIFIILYVLYLYSKKTYKKKSMDIPKIIVKPSHEQKKHLFLLGFLCLISIVLILLLNIDFDIDVYTKIKIMNLRLNMPLFYIIIAFLLWYFAKKLRPTVFYENYISYQGNIINWKDICRVKRTSNTKLTIYYKNGINSRIDLFHSEEQKMIIDQLIINEARKTNNLIIDL